MTAVINLIKVYKGKDEGHLIFEGYVPGFDNNRVCKFDFMGDQICYTTSGIPSIGKMNLVECLAEDFGLPPYDFKKAKNVLAEGKIYSIDLY